MVGPSTALAKSSQDARSQLTRGARDGSSAIPCARSGVTRADNDYRCFMSSSFDERAPEWDTPERRERARRLAAVIRERVRLDRSIRALEVGAGTGLLGLELAPEVGSIVLSDPSQGMRETTRQKLAASDVPNATVASYDLGGAAPDGAPFDLVISLLVLHHVEDTAGALRSIRRLLVPGGTIALLDLEAEDGSFHSDDAPGVHHDGFERGHMVELAQQVGFADVVMHSTINIEKEGRSYPLFLLTGRRV